MTTDLQKLESLLSDERYTDVLIATDDLRAALFEITSLRKRVEEDQWQDISSAPRDGTEFLAAFRGHRIICRWSKRYSQWVGVNIEWYDGHQTVTVLTDGWGKGGPEFWRPLPALPTPVSSEGEV